MTRDDRQFIVIANSGKKQDEVTQDLRAALPPPLPRRRGLKNMPPPGRGRLGGGRKGRKALPTTLLRACVEIVARNRKEGTSSPLMGEN